MSFRIDRAVAGEEVVFFISGRITGEHVGTLRSLLEESTDSVVAVDLEKVNLVDREAVKLLARCETEGRELRHCPPYIREWVTTETAKRRPRRSRKQDMIAGREKQM